MSPSIDYTKGVFNEEENKIIANEVRVVRQKYPQYIPIIVRSGDKSIDLLKTKYLVQGTMTLGQLLVILRKRNKCVLKPSQSIHVFIGSVMPGSSELLMSIYDKHKNKDNNMLFLTICKENTFG